MGPFYHAACIQTHTSRAPHLGHDSVHDERFDGSDMALRVINGDKEVFGVGVLLLLLILVESVVVDHGGGRVGRGTSICQRCVLDRREEATVSPA